MELLVNVELNLSNLSIKFQFSLMRELKVNNFIIIVGSHGKRVFVVSLHFHISHEIIRLKFFNIVRARESTHTARAF